MNTFSLNPSKPNMLKRSTMLLALLLISAVSAENIRAQIIRYELIPSANTNFRNVYVSSVHLEDLDGDGDLDAFIGGQDDLFAPVTHMYLNDSYGNFTEVVGSPFTAMSACTSDFADVDGDGDLDLIYSGAVSGTAVLEYFLNDGTGGFTLAPSGVFTPVFDGDIDFADFDNDGDQDVYISGNTGLGTFHAALYTNDGFGVFTLFAGPTPPFVGYSVGDASISDLDGDGFPEVLVSGNNFSGSYTGLYKSSPFGGVINLSHPFPDQVFTATDFADVDNDGDQDLIIAGQLSSPPIDNTTQLYLNDGSGSFSLVAGTPFQEVQKGVVLFEDIENDGDQDVLITGLNEIGNSYTEIYQNDGSGVFTLTTGFIMEGVNFFGSADFGDIDNDGDQDLLVTGFGSSAPVTKLYRNISMPLSSIPECNTTDPCYINHIMGDIDCDGSVATSDLVILLANYGTTI